MAEIRTVQALRSAKAQFARDARRAFTDTASRAGGVLLRYMDADGVIPLASENLVRREVGTAIDDLFTAPSVLSPYADGRAPFGTGNIGLAPYPRALNAAIARAVVDVAQQHARHIARQVSPDLRRWLLTAQVPPVAEQYDRLVSGSGFARYDAPHTWVDPRGYRLSDRIWNTDRETRMKIDRLLAEGIRSGRSARAMESELERFLIPGRARLRTRRPYGTDASFDAMRLARTEISHAHAEVTFLATYQNPFVTGMEWALSRQHPRIDICDALATIGMDGQRLREPYPLDSAPMIVRDSHPQCLCTNYASVTPTAAEIDTTIAELEAAMARNEPAPLTPLALLPFLTFVLPGLWELARDRLDNEFLLGILSF